MTTSRFTRRPERAPVRALRGPIPDAALLVELTGGDLPGQALARGLCSHLGLPEPSHVVPLGALRSDRERDRGGDIAAIIDAEASGDRIVAASLRAARGIGEAVLQRRTSHVVVVGPDHADAWEREDRLLLELLAQIFEEGPAELALVEAPAPAQELLASSAELCAKGMQRYAEGGVGRAARCFEAAQRRAANPVEAAVAELHLQSARIASLQFAEAARAGEPSPELPPELRGVLLQCRAWGEVLSGDPSAAAKGLARARALLEGSIGEREWLYLMNISALAELKCGRSDAAYAIERSIAERLDAMPRRDFHLEYVNCLNLARLARGAGRHAEAERLYARAFATCEGLRSDSDQVYANVCWADLQSRSGKPQPALAGWLRAALHYLSAPEPEALAPRVARAIGGDALAELHPLDLPEAIAEKLRRRILELAETAGFSIPSESDGAAVSFARPDRAGALGPATLGHGWSAFPCDDGSEAQRRGPHWDALGALLDGWIRCYGSRRGLRAATWVVAADIGSEMPLCEPDLIASELRLGVRRDPALEARCRVTLSPAISHAQECLDGGVELAFKRYRAAERVSPGERALLDRIQRGGIVSELDLHSHLPVLRELERRRIVRLQLET